MNKQRIVKPIIKDRLIYIYNPDPIRFFFWHKPEGLLIANFRFRVRYSRCNSKNLNKLHILIRLPLFCIDRNNGGTTIGNKYQLFFVKHIAKGSKKMINEKIVPISPYGFRFPTETEMAIDETLKMCGISGEDASMIAMEVLKKLGKSNEIPACCRGLAEEPK